jgi:hypothetical protein
MAQGGGSRWRSGDSGVGSDSDSDNETNTDADAVADTGPQLLSVPATPFTPCEAFEGGREGYVFKKGEEGVGYYADTYGIKLANDKIVKEYYEKKENLGAVAGAVGGEEEGDPLDRDTISTDSAQRVVQYLIETCQVPTEKLVITTGQKWPVEVRMCVCLCAYLCLFVRRCLSLSLSHTHTHTHTHTH